MTAQNVVAFALVALLALYVATLWIIAARRRGARARALKVAQKNHKSDQAWKRLNRSSAGAP